MKIMTNNTEAAKQKKVPRKIGKDNSCGTLPTKYFADKSFLNPSNNDKKIKRAIFDINVIIS